MTIDFGKWAGRFVLPLYLISALLTAVIQQLVLVRDAHAEPPELLPVLAHVGPWPVVSRPVLYRGRLWFANSVKGIDHNSADIYSLGADMADGRYERHLWSQDAGEPSVADGLLYWPSEDSRLFGDWGEFQMTNGERWKTGLIPVEGIFHIHGMAQAGGLLYAATSAWQAAIHVSADRGRTWQRIYLHPNSGEGISRIISLTVLRDKVIGVFREQQKYRLLLASADGARFIKDWPAGRTHAPLATLDGWTYGLVSGSGRTELWRTDGMGAELVHHFAPSIRPFALSSGNGALWVLNGNKTGGTILKSFNGGDWTPNASFDGGEAYELLVSDDVLVVSGAGSDGRGIVWGRFTKAPVPADDPPDLPELMPPGPPQDIDWDKAASRLDSALLDPRSYENVGRSMRDRVFDLAMARPAAGFFAGRLDSPRATGALNPFRDVIIPDQGSIGAFWLLWGLGLSKNGIVPPGFISEPWTVPRNSAAKYFEPQLMAMWAASEIGQADPSTINALMSRVTNSTDPHWLRMDAVGALTALTGIRHGADFVAWKRWYGE